MEVPADDRIYVKGKGYVNRPAAHGYAAIGLVVDWSDVQGKGN